MEGVARLAVKVRDAAEMLGMSESAFRKQALPELPIVRIGSLIRICVSDLERWQLLSPEEISHRLTCPLNEAIAVIQVAGGGLLDGRWRLKKSAFESWLATPPALQWQKAPGPDYSQDGLVYLIQAGPSGAPIKLGWTRDLTSRLTTLQTSCPYDLQVRATCQGSQLVELAFHARFSSLRMRGEWFRHEGELADLLEALENGGQGHV